MRIWGCKVMCLLRSFQFFILVFILTVKQVTVHLHVFSALPDKLTRSIYSHTVDIYGCQINRGKEPRPFLICGLALSLPFLAVSPRIDLLVLNTTGIHFPNQGELVFHSSLASSF